LVDLERYLELLPEGEQDLTAIAQVESLRSALAATLDLSPPASATAIPAVQGGVGPGGALFRGLLFPGLGQLSTGRPFFGLAVLAATGGAIYYGTLTEEGVRRESGTDPFGNPYEYDVRFQDRPNLAVGVATAAGI